MGGEQRRSERDPQIQAEISAFLKLRRESLDVVTTTVTRSGQVLDWVPLQSQAPDGVLEPPPPPSQSQDAGGGDEASPVRFELEDQPEARGPEGTVPVVRPDPRRVYSAGGVRGLLAKGSPPRQPGSDAPDRALGVAQKYAAAVYDDAANYGGICTLNVWSPFVGWTDNLSLSQIAEGGGSGPGFQGVEAGWVVFSDITGDFNPHLFVFFTTNGYGQYGDYVGGWNQLVKGWVQVSTTIYPNALLTPSQLGDTQWEVVLGYSLGNGAWWVSVGGQWIGYYPASLFATSGIQSSASRISYYGETGDAHLSPATTGLQMGSGRFPSEGYGYAAYQRNLSVQLSSGGNLQRFTPSWTTVTQPSYYKLDPQYKNTGPWESYCYLGGPGAT